MLVARGPDGTPRGAVYLVHDDDVTYYLLGGADDVGRANGAMTLLLWEGVRRAAGWRDGAWRDGVIYSILRTDPAAG